MKKIIVYWSRRDFRLNDNPALFNAAKIAAETRTELLPIFVLEDYMLEADPKFQFGYPSRLFLSRALPEFAKHFKRFFVVKGKGAQTFVDLAKHFELDIHVNEDIYQDFYSQIKKLKKNNITVTVYKDMQTVDKDLRTGAGNLYSVFTPFKKACWSAFMSENVLPKVDTKTIPYLSDADSAKIPNQVQPTRDAIWNLFSKNRAVQVGKHLIDITEILGRPDEYVFPYNDEETCLLHFERYLEHDLTNYKADRDSLEKDKTSRMSLGLCWGLVSARTLKCMITDSVSSDLSDFSGLIVTKYSEGPATFLSELIWREFYKYLFFHYPRLMQEEFQEKFRFKVEWVKDAQALERFHAWIKGETGYKIVDAAMMQLKQTGWMHNRARMIVASVLTKNLGVDWRWGQEYFRAMLVDLDESSNNGGWQWAASVGADPKPIRIFNPYLQAENYDAEGIYQKKWLSEEAYQSVLPPLVDHKAARADALRRYGLVDRGVRHY